MMGKQQGVRRAAYVFLEAPTPSRYHVVFFCSIARQTRGKLPTDGSGIYKGIDR